jgi:predicted SnoaL-like aldol condensation-catalyzing enzyme
MKRLLIILIPFFLLFSTTTSCSDNNDKTEVTQRSFNYDLNVAIKIRNFTKGFERHLDSKINYISINAETGYSDVPKKFIVEYFTDLFNSTELINYEIFTKDGSDGEMVVYRLDYYFTVKENNVVNKYVINYYFVEIDGKIVEIHGP